MKNEQNHKRKVGIAVLAGLAITGIIGASAASLGGIDSDTLGADVGVVGSCDTDGVTVEYAVSFDSEAGEAEVDSVDIGSVNALCNGLTYDVTLLDGAGANIGDRQGVVVLLAGEFTVLFSELPPATTGVSAEDVEGISIALFGAPVLP